MIRKVAPALIAQEIVGVQPMPASAWQGFEMKPKQLTFGVLDRDSFKSCPDGYVPVMTNIQIAHWIEQQPVHTWKHMDMAEGGKMYILNTHFFISDELLTLLTLKWA